MDSTVAPSGKPERKTWQVGTLTYTTGGLVILFCWLLWGDFAWSMRDRVVPPVMQLLFKKFGASDMVTGLLFASLPAAIGVILGPIVGYKSDRLRSRWGRRLPFLAIPTPFIVASIVGLAFAPQIGAFVHTLPSFQKYDLQPTILIVFGLFWTIFEISCLIANAVFTALVNDVVPQEVLGRFFGLFRALSLIAAILFNYSLFGMSESYFCPIFLALAVLYGGGFTLMCLKVKEGDYPPPPPEPEGGAFASIQSYFKDGFGQPYYLWFFAVYVLAWVCTSPFNLYAVFFSSSMGMNHDAYGKYYAAIYAVSLALAYPLGVLADRFHPLRVTLGAMALYGVAMAWGAFFVHDSASFAVALIAHGVLSGTIYTAIASLGQRLLPRSKFAEINSAGQVLLSLMNVVLPITVGRFLDLHDHQYRYTFTFGLVFAVIGLAAGAVLHRKFMALGGPKHYVAPA